MDKRPRRREFFSMATAAGLGALLASALARAQTPSYAIYPDIATGRLKIRAPKGIDVVEDQAAFGLAPARYVALIRQEQNGDYVAYNGDGYTICRNSPTACIQEAVNYVNGAGGGTVYIKRGTYYMDQPVVLDNISNVRIIGDGYDATKIIIRNGGGFKKDSSTPTYNLEFAYFTLDARNLDATKYPVYGIYLWINTYNVYIHHLKLLNFNNRMPIHAEKVSGWIYDNYIENTTNADAIAYAVADYEFVYVVGNYVKKNGFGGITTGAYNGSTVIANNFVDTDRGYACISIENFFGYIKEVQIIGNKCVGHPDVASWSAFGIAAGNKPDGQPLERAVVIGNILENGVIFVTGAKRAIVSDNIIINPVNALGGIVVDSALTGGVVEITNNIVVHDKQWTSGTTTLNTPRGIHIEDLPGGFATVKGNSVIGNAIGFVVGYGFAEARGLGTYVVDFDLNDNHVYNAQYPIYFYSGNVKLKRNKGTAVFSGNGSTTRFSISHGLASTPSKVYVTKGSSLPDFYVTADANNIYVNFVSAPPSGTNNVVLYWYAEV
jgi:hypothetical protein